MRITRVHHVHITVPKNEEAEARRFYCDVVGMPELEKPDSLKSCGGFWVEVSGQQVHIGTEDGVDRRASKAHIAYQVSDLDRWKAKLIAEGIEIGDSVPIPGF